jgi:hypothetical protein
LKGWKLTISHLGTKAEKQLLKIAKCCAKIVIEGNQENKDRKNENLEEWEILI